MGKCSIAPVAHARPGHRIARFTARAVNCSKRLVAPVGNHLAHAVKVSLPRFGILIGTALPLVQRPMDYSIFSYSTGEPLDTVAMHVLARAYRAAWRSMYLRDPDGPQVLHALDVEIVFAANDDGQDTNPG
jgi:hypothetical protein